MTMIYRLFLISSILSVSFRVFACDSKKELDSDSSTTFKVSGVCAMCKHRIEEAVKGKGVHAASWDVDTKILTLVYDPSKVTLDKIHNRITAAGHDTYLKKANDADYNALPSCCRYRDIKSMDDIHNDHLQSPSGGTSSFHLPASPDKTSSAMQNIRGVVLEADEKGSYRPLTGATVAWLGNKIATTTDSTGVFNIAYINDGNRLTISYAGFQSDTISVLRTNEIKIILASNKLLKEVKVTGYRLNTYTNYLDAIRTTVMTKTELFKAACCNLSESFETNPSVDVSYNDALTGSKQIQLLGLSGNYTQLTVENLPGPRGLATALGLNSIPGPWIESIQLIKGTGSVANGYESIAGQINVELKKPQSAERFFANVYENDFGKTDVNINLSQKVSKKWSTALLLHDDWFGNKRLDVNNDGFRDLPTGNLFSGVNRWAYTSNNGFMTQFGMKFLSDDKTGGQSAFDPANDKNSGSVYGLGIKTKRIEGFGKIGYVFPMKKYKSIGLQLSAFDHRQDSYFGQTIYNGHQQNFYSNLIYQSIIHNIRHKFRTGLSFVYDDYNEDFNASNYKRKEIVPGAFFEYTYSPSEKFDVVAGLREDHNSINGWFTTPRLNVRYAPIKGTTIRASAGRGQRTANIFAENNSVFVSSRQVNILNGASGKAYGLDPEVSWNKGITVDQMIRLFGRNAQVTVEYFRNDFQNQVIVDLENPREVNFYNLKGRSFSNSFQTEISFEPLRRFNVRMAYRFFDVRTTINGTLVEKPLIAKDRAFVNLAYETKGWKFDYTVNFNGNKRIPSTEQNAPPYVRPNVSPTYVLMNSQISKTLGKKSNIDFYIGAENLTNYYQKDPIIAAEKPFGPYFDASLVWGPVSGRMFYGGIRYAIK